jgi:hypothetical protein
MVKLLALTDYKGRFGSKHFDHPYRSGMDKEKLQAAFRTYGVELFFMPMSSVWQKITRETKFFIYTSSEDDGYLYKSYIEDIVFGLAQKGYVPIPGIAHLRANNNKGMMEFLRQATGDERINTINTQFFGTIEELKNEMPAFSYPVVIKKAAGASGRGVYKASNPEELLKAAQLVSSSKSLLLDLKDWLRSKRHKGYQLDSRFRNKFIKQNFIPDFKNQVGNITVRLLLRLYPQTSATPSSLDPYIITPTTDKVDTRARGRQISLRIESSALGDNWRYGTLRVDIQPDGLR